MLSTPRLHLRMLGPSDAAEVTAYLARNRDHFASAGPLVADEYFTEEYQYRRLTRELEMTDEGTFFRFWVYRHLAEDSGPIGDISLSHIIHGIMHSCFLGYKIDHAHLRRGYMTEALECVVGFGFERVGLHRIEANIMPSNIASQRTIEKVGFQREGYSPKYLMINGLWQDHLRYARINDAWSETAAESAQPGAR